MSGGIGRAHLSRQEEEDRMKVFSRFVQRDRTSGPIDPVGREKTCGF